MTLEEIKKKMQRQLERGQNCEKTNTKYRELIKESMKKLSILLIALALTSCGARKVQKSETVEKETTTLTDTTKTVVQVDNLTNVQIVENCEEITFKPIDNTKEMVVNGKSYLNTVLTHKKTNVTTNTKSVNKSLTTVKKGVSLRNDKVKTITVKNTKRDAVSMWWLLWFVIPIIIVYIAWRNRKKIIEEISRDIPI